MKTMVIGVAFAFGLVFAACGGKTTNGDTSGDTTSGSGGGAGSGSTGAGGAGGAQPTCESVCKRISDACTNIDFKGCSSTCNSSRAMYPQCTSVLDEYMSCLSSARLTCPVTGDMSVTHDCDASADRFAKCTSGPGVPPPSVDAGVPPQCANIPVPPQGPMACSGSGGTTGVTTGGGQATCTTECRDNSGHSWASICVGTSCSCTYDGKKYCDCVTSGNSCLGGGCCPVTH